MALPSSKQPKEPLKIKALDTVVGLIVLALLFSPVAATTGVVFAVLVGTGALWLAYKRRRPTP